MDPATATAAATILQKLISLGISSWKASSSAGFSDADVAVLQGCIDVGLGAGGAAAKRESIGPTLPARHLALVARAFGEAWSQHWAGNVAMAPTDLRSRWRDYVFSDNNQRDRKRDLRARLTMALTGLDVGHGDVASAFAFATAVVSDPIATPYYRSLWKAFADPDLDEDNVEPPLHLAPDGRLEFERDFRIAYAEGLAGDEGRAIRDYLFTIEQDRAPLMRELLIRDMATWRHRDIFGADRFGKEKRLLSLQDLYVEPFAVVQQRSAKSEEAAQSEPQRVLGLLSRLLDDHPIVVVTADFGYGKSLTARTLACQWASEYISDLRSPPVSPFPVYIKCVDDLLSHTISLPSLVARSMQRQARTFGCDFKATDTAFSMPPEAGRTVFLLDGLDEIALTERELEQLFDHLRENASAKHRFVVFSRPAAIHRRDRLLVDVPEVQLQPLTTSGIGGAKSQVEDWLDRWMRLNDVKTPITLESLTNRSLLTIASTPIILFMIAHTWDEHPNSNQPRTRAAIYEAFFTQIARGKHELAVDENRQIADASTKLRDALVRCRLLPSSATATDSMLWLMSRIAWEAHRLSERAKSLALFDVQKVLREELGFDDGAGVEQAVQMGLLLALQADLERGGTKILFGHQSFREFLVARFWSDRVSAASTMEEEERARVEDDLTGAQLLRDSDETFEFLTQMLGSLDQRTREKILQWSTRCVNDERLASGCTRLRDDRRFSLRHAALAIGGTVAASLGRDTFLELKDAGTLRSIMAAYWLNEVTPKIVAKKIRCHEIRASECEFARADFSGSDFADAAMTDISAFSSSFRGCNLTGARMAWARLYSADLSGAKMGRAWLRFARATNAKFVGCDLRDSFLMSSYFQGADFTSANLERANLGGADFDGACLRGANLKGVLLRHREVTRTRSGERQFVGKEEVARFSGADLRDADLSDVDLGGVDLSRAQLQGARLVAANLRGANLEGASLDEEVLDALQSDRNG